jgi:hypothetical protein
MSRFLDTASKITVLLSAVAAVALQVVLGARGWGPLLPISITLFVAAFALTRWFRVVGWSLVFATMYLVPVMFQALHGGHEDVYFCVWLAACLGAILGDVRSLRWEFPGLWRWPLAYWALAVALVWPILVAREADFRWSLLSEYHIGNSGLGGPPAVVSVWMLSVTLTHLLGLLWFESTFRHYPFGDHQRFVRSVIVPLSIGAALGCALAVYQSVFDIHFLNAHQWPSLNRAAGSLIDGDAFGALAALWILGFLALAAQSDSRARSAAYAVAAAMALAGMWATGSRIALVGAGMGLLFALWFGAQAWWRLPSRLRIGLVVAALLVTVGGGLAVRSWFSSHSPFARLMATLPSPSVTSVKQFAVKELWNRHGPFGTISMRMVRQSPIAGIGVGCFNHMFTDQAFSLTLWNRHHFDNAQSWYRHQLAELGILGSVGWVLWVVTFGVVLVRHHGSGTTRVSAGLVRGALIVTAVMSLVSMPTQNVSVALTVWVFAAWFLQLSPGAQERLNRSAPTPWPAWLGLWVLVLVFAGATAWQGYTKLRVPQRAALAEWEYEHGFHDPETPADRPPFRWTDRKAVDVFSVEDKVWLKLTIRGGPPDAATRPFGYRVRVRDDVVIDVPRSDGSERTWYIKIRDKEHHMMVQVEPTRTWKPSDFTRVADDRELGVQVDQWVFVKVVPPGAETIVR